MAGQVSPHAEEAGAEEMSGVAERAPGADARVEFRASEMGLNKRQNQDWSAITRLPMPRRDQSAILLSVADGHGAKQYPRSDLGARFAVAAFQRTAARFFADAEPGSWSALEPKATGGFRKSLALQWRRSVVLHAANNPPPGDPFGAASEARVTAEETIRLYGATLIAALLAPGLFAAWQIGDGDLVVVDAGTDARPGGHRLRFPLPQTGPELGDQTDSLSHRDAHARMRMIWEPGVHPALISLSTDGLSKSFADQDGFRSFCTGLFEQLRSGGQNAVAESLPAWLARAAAHSGDDSTLCALYDPTAV